MKETYYINDVNRVNTENIKIPDSIKPFKVVSLFPVAVEWTLGFKGTLTF